MKEIDYERISFLSDDNEEIIMKVEEQTTLNGVNYLLVSDEDDEDENAMILKEVSEKGAEETVYDVVEDEKEFAALADIFRELLEDVDIEET